MITEEKKTMMEAAEQWSDYARDVHNSSPEDSERSFIAGWEARHEIAIKEFNKEVELANKCL